MSSRLYVGEGRQRERPPGLRLCTLAAGPGDCGRQREENATYVTLIAKKQLSQPGNARPNSQVAKLRRARAVPLRGSHGHRSPNPRKMMK